MCNKSLRGRAAGLLDSRDAPSPAGRPEGLGGFGYGHGKAKVSFDGKDVTDAFLAGNGFTDDDITYNKPLFEVGGGVAVPIGRFDIGKLRATVCNKRLEDVDDIKLDRQKLAQKTQKDYPFVKRHAFRDEGEVRLIA